MKIQITIKDEYVEFEGIGKLQLEDVIIHIDKIGILRGDYLLNQLLDYHHIPNKISEARDIEEKPMLSDEVKALAKSKTIS